MTTDSTRTPEATRRIARLMLRCTPHGWNGEGGLPCPMCEVLQRARYCKFHFRGGIASSETCGMCIAGTEDRRARDSMRGSPDDGDEAFERRGDR